MFAGAGWEYDLNERTGKFYTTLSYRGWYPALDLRFTAGNRASYAQYQKTGEIFRFTWQETTFTALIGIPWNFLHGRYSRSLHPSAGTTLISVVHNSTTPENFTSGLIRTMDYRLSASQFQLSGQKDLYPRIGQSIDLTYRNCPFGGNDMGSIFAVDMSLYFPGIIRHHGIFIYAGYQHRDGEDLSSYSFSNLIAYPRGYSGAYDEDLLTLRLNYAFPIWYPDLSLGSVIYLKRLKMNLYYDWANGKNPGYINEYQSTGAELTFDFHLLRFISPIEFGVRSIYYPTVGHWGAEILYSISY